MFEKNVYIERRKRLREQVQSGIVLLFGNEESPMNYADNQYPFRQDSTFLYFFGLDKPGLATIIDMDEGTEIVFGNDLTIDEIVWTGPQPSLHEICLETGVSKTAPGNELVLILNKASQQGRKIHFLPQYRPENLLKIRQLLSIELAQIPEHVSVPLIKAVVAQRSIKSKLEIEQIEIALDVSHIMQTMAMRMSKPGVFEREVVGAMEGIALSEGMRLAFPTIFSIHGETLHNPYHNNKMKDTDMAVNDSGAESPLHYASDITRTIPVGGKFTAQQKEIYNIVLNAQEKAIDAVKPGIEFRDIHHLTCTILASGLKDIGLIKGNIWDAVDAGAHTLFFQCGLGHMMGLDVHDMEPLGEDYVGYTDTIKRNLEFGWKSLRLARVLEPGFVITVEPGIYFIPELIDRWKVSNQCADFINYQMVEKYKIFGGIRLEDDVLVTGDSHRILGKPIPKTIEDVEQTCA
jgi:Xaa-Pro aminopeptidase